MAKEITLFEVTISGYRERYFSSLDLAKEYIKEVVSRKIDSYFTDIDPKTTDIYTETKIYCNRKRIIIES